MSELSVVDPPEQKTRPHRRRLMLLSMTAAAAAVAGCSGGGNNAAPPGSVAPTRAVTSSPASVTPETSSPAPHTSAPEIASATTPAAPAVVHCTHAMMRVVFGPSGAGLGHESVIVDMTNLSRPNQTCVMQGYFGVDGLDATGHLIDHAKREPRGFAGGLAPGQTQPPKVVLAPGQDASFRIEATDNPVGNQTACPTDTTLAMTPPDTTDTFTMPFALSPNSPHGIYDCTGLGVTPVVPGVTGNG